MTQPEKPGLYPDLRDTDYHAWPAISQSRLKAVMLTPAHLRWELDHPKEPTDSMRLGSALHDAVLLPDLFEKRYTVAGPCEARKKDGTRCTNQGSVCIEGQFFCGVKGHSPGGLPDQIDVLSVKQWDALNYMRDNVWARPEARELLENAQARELSGLFVDPDTGLTAKCRFDAILDDHTVCIDIKTTKDASDDGFPYEIDRYGYYLQGGFYVPAGNLLGLKLEYFAFIAVENHPPYLANTFELRDAAIDTGIEELQPLMQRYKWCLETGEWPGYSPGVKVIDLPPNAYRKHESRLARWEYEDAEVKAEAAA